VLRQPRTWRRPAGWGRLGGASRGAGRAPPGPGNRLRLGLCECPRPLRVREAAAGFTAHCDGCGSAFKRAARVDVHVVDRDTGGTV